MKKFLAVLLSVLLLLSCTAMFAACGEIEDVALEINFDGSSAKRIVATKINFDEESANGLINIGKVDGVKTDGKALSMTVKSMSNDQPYWWIAGVHFDKEDTSWAGNGVFTEIKKITFDYYSEVKFPLKSADYSFVAEFAWKVVKNGTTTDANWVIITVPFGIQNTNGNWYTASIVLDDLTAYKLQTGKTPTSTEETQFGLEWFELGLSWDAEDYEWAQAFGGKTSGRIVVDNIRFWNSLASNEKVAEQGRLQVVSYDKTGAEYYTGNVVKQTPLYNVA